MIAGAVSALRLRAVAGAPEPESGVRSGAELCKIPLRLCLRLETAVRTMPCVTDG